MTDLTTLQVRRYLVVFGALLVLTALTVAVSYVHLPTTPAVTVGVTIALAKAALVAMFFMHLRHERRVIYMALILAAVLFIGLFGLILWSEADHVPGTRFEPAVEPQSSIGNRQP